MSQASSAYPKSDLFSGATKLEIKQLSGDACWTCETDSPQVAYVVAKEDKQIPLWNNAGLLNFPLTSAQNGIPLCPTCHAEFDRAHDPGFVFIPVDLQYFIDFELQDSETRALAAKDGDMLSRSVPTNTMYRNHLLEQRIISDTATSGLYQPIFLKTYLYGGRFSPEDLGLTEPKPWHGAPLSSLRRAFLALGSVRVSWIDRKTRDQLDMLRSLYFDDYKELVRGTGTRQAKPDLLSWKRHTDDDELGGPNKRIKMADKAGMHEPKNTGGRRTGHHTGHHLNAKTDSSPAPWLSQEEWTLGPQFTTEEIVQRYANVVVHN